MNTSTATTPALPSLVIEPLVRYLDGASKKEAESLNKAVFSKNPTQLQELITDEGGGVLQALASATATLYMLVQAHQQGATLSTSKIIDCLEPVLTFLEVAENDFTCALERVGAIQYKVRA